MRRLVPARKVSLLKFASLGFIFVLLGLSACRPASLTALVGQRSARSNSQPAPRKTSQPYTGDLSIFEYKDRDEKLQVQRVMDILQALPLLVFSAVTLVITLGDAWAILSRARFLTPVFPLLTPLVIWLMLMGVGCLVLTLHLANWVARVWAGLAEIMLGVSSPPSWWSRANTPGVRNPRTLHLISPYYT